jgi:hypothetical protein
MRTSSKLLFFSIFLLNGIHLLLPFEYQLNKSFNPSISFLALGISLFIIQKVSDFKKDRKFLVCLILASVTQNVSYHLNSGVPDYINFGIFKSNIPDMLLFTTILTWWYYRVYKLPKLNPAK